MARQPAWFSNRGQIIQTAISLVACAFAAVKAWPDILDMQFFALSPLVFLLLAILTGAWFLTMAHRHRHSADPTTSSGLAPASVQPAAVIQPAVPSEDTPAAFSAEVKVGELKCRLGELHKLTRRDRTVSVCVNEIVPYQAEEPHLLCSVGDHAADILFDSGGGLFHGGAATKMLSTNRFKIPAVRNLSNSEPASVGFHYYDREHTHVFVSAVTHINPHAKELTLSWCWIYGRCHFEVKD